MNKGTDNPHSTNVTMKWTREKALLILRDELPELFAKDLTDDEVFYLGESLGYWKKVNE